MNNIRGESIRTMDLHSNISQQQQQQQATSQHVPVEGIYESPISAINQEVRRRNVVAAASFQSVIGSIHSGGGGSSSSGVGSGGITNHYNADPWDEIHSTFHTTTTTSDVVATTWHPHELFNHQQQSITSDFCTCRFLTRQRRLSSNGWKTSSSSVAVGVSASAPIPFSTKPQQERKYSASLYDRKRSISSASTSNNVCTRCGKKISPMNTSNNRNFVWSAHHGRSNSFSYLNKEVVSSSPNSNSNHSSNMHDLPDIPHHAQALLFVTPQLRFISVASTDMQGTASSNKNNTHSNILAQIIQAAIDRTTSTMNTGGSGGSNSSSGSSIGGVTTSNFTSLGTGNNFLGVQDEYQCTLIRDRSNQQAAAELASLLWVLAHEMSLEEYGVVESQVFTAVFALVHSTDRERRMAGLVAIDALLVAPSADEERKSIKFANTLSNGLRSAQGDFEFVSAVCKALGHMVTRTANVDFVESEVTRSLEWLRTERSDRRLAACLSLIEFATHLPTTFHSKTSQATLGQGGSNEFIDHIFKAICDIQPIVRACATDALSQCLKILVERQHQSLTGLLCQVYFSLMDGLQQDTTNKKQPRQDIAATEAAQHGSLLVVGTMLATTHDFMLPRFEETCRAVLQYTSNPLALVRLEVVRLIPRLALRCPSVFGRRYLEDSLNFLMHSASSPPAPRVGIDLRPSAFACLGQLILAMTDEATGQVIGGNSLPTIKISDDPSGSGQGQIVELRKTGIIYSKLSDIFALVYRGLQFSQSNKKGETSTVKPALHCAASLVEALGDLALPYIPNLIDKMFEAGLSNDLIQCLQLISACAPAQQNDIEDRMLQGVSLCLAGQRYDPRTSLSPTRVSGGLFSSYSNRQEPRFRNDDFVYDPMSGGVYAFADIGTENVGIVINMSSDGVTIKSLVLGLETLSSFGGVAGKVSTSEGIVPLLPFVNEVAACYLLHPSFEVRKAASLTCCTLLIPHATANKKHIGAYTGGMVECVLERLLQTAASDPSATVRLCVVEALDSRYDTYLCQSHHLRGLFLLVQDEALAVRAAGLRMLGRLASINPGPILPVLRRLLNDLIVELQCGASTGRVREEATRLLVVYLRASPLQRLVHPLLQTLVNALPLDKAAPPRLASASLEALGELAHASGYALQPWVKDVIPHVLEIMEDKSSASKQRTSLRTLGQIAGSTGYVISPYLDYPKLLTQATEILPATKRAPWSLRREVIRTLGILGALDPDRYHEIASKTVKGGAFGGAYFEVEVRSNVSKESSHTLTKVSGATNTTDSLLPSAIGTGQKEKTMSAVDRDADENEPASNFMYEQYAMTAQPVTILPPSKRTTPLDDAFYPAVTIQALMRIFRDSSLVVHHGMVVQAVMFIFKSLGVRCVPFLNRVVPDMIDAIKISATSNLRESLLMQLAALSTIVREHLRPYTVQIFDIIAQFWSSRHMSTILELISSLAVGSPDEFRLFVPKLIQLLLGTFDEMQVAEWSFSPTTEAIGMNKGRADSQRLKLVLNSIFNLKAVFGEYLRIIVPALLKLAYSFAVLMNMQDTETIDLAFDEIAVSVYRTVASLVQGSMAINQPSLYYLESKIAPRQSSENGLPACVVQPLVRTLLEKPPKSTTVGFAIVETLCVCAVEVGGRIWFQLYDGVIRDAIEKWQRSFPPPLGNDIPHTSHSVDGNIFSCLELYDAIIKENLIPDTANLFSGTATFHFGVATENLMAGNGEFAGYFEATSSTNELLSPQTTTQTAKLKVNQGKLQRAWDVSQKSSRDDWDEWMRRFAIQLLREAPSPALRASSSLAQAYQPLARELFSAAFACCWKELDASYRADLVRALKAAFVANISPEILQALLNLAEFMEHDPSHALPIEIPVLAELALKCRAYAKALHYAERQYNLERTSACVESLISINGKLDLPEAALGVLKVSSLGEINSDVDIVNDDRSLDVFKYSDHEMFYSVIWSTADNNIKSNGLVDIAPREELWLAKLGAWTEALVLYEEKLQQDANNYEAVVGCMRCLSANGEWRKVLDFGSENWTAISGITTSEPTQHANISKKSQRKAVRMCAQAAWRLGQWGDLEKYASHLVHGGEHALRNNGLPSRERSIPSIDFDGAFYSAVLHVHRTEWVEAANSIDAARRAMDSRLTALMAESYRRAYPSMVTAQNLAELEEVVEFRMLEERVNASVLRHPTNRHSVAEARKNLLSVWSKRLAGCRIDAEVHGSILAVRSLVLEPTDEVESILTLSELSRQSQRYKFAERILLDSLDRLDADLNGQAFGFPFSEKQRNTMHFPTVHKESLPFIIDSLVSGDLSSILPAYGPQHELKCKSLVESAGGLDRLTIQHRLYFAFLRHLWYTDRRDEALTRLSCLSDVVEMVSNWANAPDTSLRVRCWLELGEWKLSRAESRGSSTMSEKIQADVLTSFKRATLLENCGYKAWHNWALLNFRIALKISEGGDINDNRTKSKRTRDHIVAAVHGFVNAINQGTKKWCASVQQDLLNLLTCLFKFGSLLDVALVINDSIASVAIEAWLGVLPQLLARIHIQDPSCRAVLHPLLTRLGEKHPQALMYPLSVLLKSPVAERKQSAESLMNSLKTHSNELVEEALLVSSELIRVAILWIEMWYDGLEDASRLYYGAGNVTAMLELLLPLHEAIEKGAMTKHENDFLNIVGSDLEIVHRHLKHYISLVSDDGISIPTEEMVTRRHNVEAEAALRHAWDINYTVFRRVNKQLPLLNYATHHLSNFSPALYRARSLELGVPGSYRVDGSYVNIEKFIPDLEIMTSKQRPRKITLRGNDGNDYVFLLKGHEDIRQDERVMQLFGLVNALLIRDHQTRKHDLKIQRYAISPLSHDCGVVGWVPHTDTLHSLIRDYRSSKSIPLNLENRETMKMAPDYELLTVMQKVEVFIETLKRTAGKGNDLYEILWLKSANSEEWLERRTRFTRSLAVMSMVGYILGLGDRHPSNLMLDKLSGRVFHIDFGDCFEVSMNRDKIPERVPFRLTRMLIKAMEVAGIEGSYRSTCEKTMSVLRDSKDSLVAMLEAFVYDPLISWRLADVSKDLVSGHIPPPANAGTTITDETADVGVNRRSMVDPISEDLEEDDDGDEGNVAGSHMMPTVDPQVAGANHPLGAGAASRERSLQIYTEMQTIAADRAVDSRIASIAAEPSAQSLAAHQSLAHSRVERSMRQRELHSMLTGEAGVAREVALNEKALRVIQRVEDKLTGTDFIDCEGQPLPVPDQVQRLIVQATSTENLCQHYIGWCAFW